MLSPTRSTPGFGSATPIASTAQIIEEIGRGNLVVLVDDEDRENEGDLVFAADFVTPEKVNFLAKFGRGLICMPVTEEHARRLRLTPMSQTTAPCTEPTSRVDRGAEGVTTGISAADRAHTIRVASRPTRNPADRAAGHVFPVGGPTRRRADAAGHPRPAATSRACRPESSAVLCEIMNDDGTMARLPDLVEFARRHGLRLGSIADLIQYRAATESRSSGSAAGPCRTHAGEFQLSPTATCRRRHAPGPGTR